METNTDSKTSQKSSIFILYNGVVTQMDIESIFDSHKYDTFEGVTFSAGGKFINQYLTPFKKIRLITGAGEQKIDSAVYNALGAPSQNSINLLRRNISHEISNLYQALTDYTKELLVNRDFELRVPVQALIHSKFYLLKNSKTGDTRLITGSANLSNQAFNAKTAQFEDIIVVDNSKDYDAFLKHFNEDLYPTTTEYFTKTYLKTAKDKLKKKPKEASIRNVSEYTVITNDQIKELEEKSFKETLADITTPNEQTGLALIAPSVLQNMRTELQDNKSLIKNEAKEDTKDDNVAIGLIHDAISTQSKEPKIKTPTALTNMYKTHVHIKDVAQVNNEVAKRQAELLDQPSMREKNKSGLLLAQSHDSVIPVGHNASDDEIRRALDQIQTLINNYMQFTVDGDEEYCSRIMEAILYAFEAPFLWEVRNRAMPEIEGQDIPQFMFVGGAAGSGKSSLLKVLMKLLGIYNNDTPTLYNNIVPSGVHNAKSLRIKQIEQWTLSDNVAPLIIDEIPDEVFTNPKYGEELVVNVANVTTERQTPFPVFISATNSSKYSFNDRAKRRSYYLSNDKEFDKEYRQEAGIAYLKVLNDLDSTLFNDFCMRFSDLLLTKDVDFWHEYGNTNNGLYDFLRPARLIFTEYYKRCGLPLPKWFPTSRYDDEQESGRDKWRKLYESAPDKFKQNPNDANSLFFNINQLNANAKQGWSIKMPAEEYRNDLDSKVVIGNKNAMTIEFNKQRFFAWLDINEAKSKSNDDKKPKSGFWNRLLGHD